MLSSRTLSRPAQLKESYIAISHHFRSASQPLFILYRSFSCHNSPRRNQHQKASGSSLAEHTQVSEGSRSTHSPSAAGHDDRLDHYKSIFDTPVATAKWSRWDVRPNRTSVIHGYITATRRAGGSLDFVDLVDPQLRKMLQLVVDTKRIGQENQEAIRQMRPHTPVAVYGQITSRRSQESSVDASAWAEAGGPTLNYHASPREAQEDDDWMELELSIPADQFRQNAHVGSVATTPQIEMIVESVKALNHFPEHIIARSDTKFPPQQRHLQLRTDSNLRKTLQARSKAQTEVRKYLFIKGFDEIETPLLFKSTPEGAREFLVPTRQRGLAYALPQSPQQFKQTLMASGISKYFQFARCFRDEDMRADRQPEFTQLDLEMSFASAEDIMKITERLVMVLWHTFFHKVLFETQARHFAEYRLTDIPRHAPLHFPRYTYTDAMTCWGCDKPDTRLGARIHQVQDIIDPGLKSKLTSLEDPIIDFMRVKVSSDPKKTREYIARFLDRPSKAGYLDNPDGSPGIFIFDPSKPMNGLSVLENEAADILAEMVFPQRGDLLVLQARPNRPFAGESFSATGELRRDLQTSLVADDVVSMPRNDEFLWITDFPLFSPVALDGQGQGGKAGIKSTHHPFTAPKSLLDVERLLTDPLACKADHFDLVINGVEVGGGSRRIHDSRIQEMVIKDVLKVPGDQAEEFRPLLEALRAGCPPHAGIALGFDRLMAILRRTNNVRDVIAFPKFANGEDKMFGAPSTVDEGRWADYHMVPQTGNKVAN